MKKFGVIFIIIILSCVLLIIIANQFFSVKDLYDFEDCNDNLLIGYKKQIDFFDLLNQESEIDTVATRYSILYQDENKREMYVFSVPVRASSEKNHTPYIKDIQSGKDNSYYFGNDYFNINLQNTKINMKCNKYSLDIPLDNVENFELTSHYNKIYNNEDKSVRYSTSKYDLFVNSTYSGMILNYEIQDYSEDSFHIPIQISNNLIYNNEKSGYVVISNNDDKTFMVYRPIVVDSSNRIFTDYPVSIKKINGDYQIIYDLPKNLNYPISLCLAIDKYKDNMFFETAAYENYPLTNFIFDDTFFFTDKKNHQSCSYMKFNLRSFTPKKPALLDSIVLNLYVMNCDSESKINIYSIRNDWCSWELNWWNRPEHKEKIGEIFISEPGWYEIDLTDYVRRTIQYDYYKLLDNSIVFELDNESNGNVLFASTDNGYMPPFFHIKYRKS